MFRSNQLLLMVQVIHVSNMSQFNRCDRCGGKAIVHGYDGSWRCVVCNPKEFVWNQEKMIYE